MSERVALVTGGARGIGRALVESLVGDGWRVAFCYRESEAEATTLVERLGGASAPPWATRCDVSDAAACDVMVADVLSRHGRIDALVHGAGPFRRVPLLEESLEGWHQTIDHNLHPVFHLSRAVAEPMRLQGGGRILTFAVANADRLMGQERITAYAVAKAGVLLLTRSLAKALGPHGITVNAISPGFIDTGGEGLEGLDAAIAAIPAGRVGQPDDVVAAARFLLSDEASYVNGANLLVSGGWGA